MIWIGLSCACALSAGAAKPAASIARLPNMPKPPHFGSDELQRGLPVLGKEKTCALAGMI
jgi:hypothetical protein